MKTFPLGPVAPTPTPMTAALRCAAALRVARGLVLLVGRKLTRQELISDRELTLAADAAVLIAACSGRGGDLSAVRYAELRGTEYSVWVRETARAMVLSEAHCLDDGKEGV